ncbi:MAG TPA: hypothetical protein VGQ36_25545 [Thermoanaerobaculia bacterium]|jgi:hypothetical protein|nr:hypothetical protein [Thermoanaerobaculia bacterium]
MNIRPLVVSLAALFLLANAPDAHAFFEDLCLPRNPAQGKLSWCLNPTCVNRPAPSRACPQQILDFATVKAGRSMIHADSTYFLAQALGYRADVAYWIAAYNEVTDYTQYVPIDQCGVQASTQNSGAPYITAQYNGFQRTNVNTDGPLDHYLVSFSPNGQGTDVHGAMGVQAIYPFYYPRPGYPLRIDDTYQKTLANLRQWGMLRSRDPGLLCVVGMTDSTGTTCLSGGTVSGVVPTLTNPNAPSPISISAPLGKKVLNLDTSTDPWTTVYYEQLGPWLDDKSRTTGTLWKSKVPIPVPVQIARLGHYLHTMQDSCSHSTYCGDESPSPPDGGDPGTFMVLSDNNLKLSFGNSCAMSPHLAGHIQETGTGDNPLPLRVYTALNLTVDELIEFGNNVAKHHEGWIVNPDLLPPDVVGGKSARGASAADLKNTLVGAIVSGTAYSRAEVYQSGVVTLPLQQTNTIARLSAMNLALSRYSDTLRNQSANPATFTSLEHMPGNSAKPDDTSVCWK